ncbi:ATPase [Dinoroseobacter shibae DFL 12 = DSM 16493]|uniref:ATPase n=1 Tax=Dinoroseobacter shibae (strain DSM 16493 / NCIMB 14021 / DFL 12) TaxID=398580 RepID=A8LQ41_DINSH|nr:MULTISPECIES: ABC transporter ATP-binding protein [Dinoroseobacter]ABV95281.1 ATPase [Dinoroseobacter shibae DFL 12 = DSM 16493]MDD9718000.1 ABC transporter ATP-binding protein [Dinoroseobacter sp. PD6]URF46687.1 ABC transporter ATP-binding protein/permease [Dinoroseobacter shibae]URF50993.1 ABC transporter ATP-binding protein/permease [Dinoroseobacter shibae]
MTAPDTQSPAPADKPRREPMFTPEDKANIAWFWRGYLREKLPWLIVVFGMVIAQGFVYQQFLRLTESGLRVIFDSGTLRDLVVICAAVFGVFAFRGVMSYLIPRVSVWIAADAVAKLRRELIHHLMELDLAFFEHTPPAAMIQKLVGQVEGLGNFVGQTTVKAGRDIATVVIVSIYLAYQQPLLFASAAIVFPVIILTMQLVSRKVKLVQAQTENAMRDYISTIDETMSGMRTVKIAGQEEVEEDRLVKSTSRLRRLTIRRNAAQAVILPCIDFAAAFVYMLVIGGGGYMVISPAFDVDGAAIIAFLIGLVLIFDPGRRIAQFVVSLQGALVQLRLVRGLYDERAGIVDAPDAVSEFDTGADLTLDNVTFGYEPDRPLFRDLSLTFGGGQVTAIVGPTGSGKTTILSLLGRLYDPIGGTVRIGDIPVNKIRISDLRQAFSVVAQDIVIFNSSILDNIRYVNPDATDAEVRAAAEAAELADVIAERGDLPVGPKGAQLSGGQKQRIAIARAFLRDAPIILLDEATSALDQKTEDKVKRALGRLARGKTTIMVAHRLSSVIDADRIYVLETGALVEQGTHAELLAKNGLYAQLFDSQKQSYGN